MSNENERAYSVPIMTLFLIIITTGRCKSALHQFLRDIMQDVTDHLRNNGHQTKEMFLPHCTWDKFGDILANSGGRAVGLYDEIVSFFSTMNMYSSAKLQVSDTKEYQDFLQNVHRQNQNKRNK